MKSKETKHIFFLTAEERQVLIEILSEYVAHLSRHTPRHNVVANRMRLRLKGNRDI